MKKKFYKKAKPKKFPRNYRSFPEKIIKNHLIYLLSILFVLSTVLIISLDLHSNYLEQTRLTDKNIKILREVVFWQEQVKIHPDFRDAYFKLALLNYQLGNFKEANKDLEKTLILDPNFEKGRELQKQLE